MNVAIPLYKGRVSPHFSTAPEMLIVLIKKDIIYSVTKLNFDKLSSTEKRRKLINLGIDTIICGGIDETTKEWLKHKGIHVIENVMGDAMDVLYTFVNKRVVDSSPFKGKTGEDRPADECKK